MKNGDRPWWFIVLAVALGVVPFGVGWVIGLGWRVVRWTAGLWAHAFTSGFECGNGDGEYPEF